MPRRANPSPRGHTCIPPPHIPPNLTLPCPHSPSLSRHLCRVVPPSPYPHALCRFTQRVLKTTRLIHRSPRDSSGTWQHPRYGTAGPYHCSRGCCRFPLRRAWSWGVLFRAARRDEFGHAWVFVCVCMCVNPSTLDAVRTYARIAVCGKGIALPATGRVKGERSTVGTSVACVMRVRCVF